MGNLMAPTSVASAPPQYDKLGMPKPQMSSMPTSNETKAVDVAVAEVENSKELENPGSLDDLHKKCKEVMAATFDGSRIMLIKTLSNNFQVSHTLNLASSKSQPSGYRFGATYVGTQEASPSEAFPVLLGDIDPDGNLNSNVMLQFSPRIRSKFASQIQNSKITVAQLTTDYRGNDYTASLTVCNPNIFNSTGVFVAQYLQSVTKSVAIGAELAYQMSPQLPGGEIAVVSMVGRYTSGDSVWSGIIGMDRLHVCYYQKASEQLQIGVELKASVPLKESVATIGYQVDLPKADLVYRGSVDTNWNVCGVLESRLQPMPFSFALSGRWNSKKQKLTLGCGLIIG